MRSRGDGRHPENAPSGKDLFVKFLHFLPGLPVRFFAVRQRQSVLFTVGIRFRIGESVQRARVSNKLKICPGGLHLVFECRHLILGYQNIGDSGTLQQADDELVEQLKQLKFGTWFDFNTDKPREQHHRLKLAWSNKITMHFMFVNRMGQQVAVKTASQLAAEIRSGQARLLNTINEKPFFEQALEKILDTLKSGNRQTTN